MNRFALLSCLALVGCATTDATDATEVSIDSEGAVTEETPTSRVVDERLISEFVLENGNTVTFFAHGDGGIVVREHGQPRTNAIGTLPQLESASPYEIFSAIAPAGAQPPVELVTDQARVVGLRAQRGEASSMPSGFRVSDVSAFYAKNLDRAFNSCTDVTAWKDSVGSSPIGANCPASGTFAWSQCTSNWTPPHVDNCGGVNCTEYFTSGYHQTRSSVCARSGDGYIRFAMGLRDHGAGNYSSWFDHTLYTGGYYYYWYSHSTQEKDFWRIIYRTGSRNANKSWWLKS